MKQLSFVTLLCACLQVQSQQPFYGEIVYESNDTSLANKKMTVYFGSGSLSVMVESATPEPFPLTIIQPFAGTSWKIDTVGKWAYPYEYIHTPQLLKYRLDTFRIWNGDTLQGWLLEMRDNGSLLAWSSPRLVMDCAGKTCPETEWSFSVHGQIALIIELVGSDGISRITAKNITAVSQPDAGRTSMAAYRVWEEPEPQRSKHDTLRHKTMKDAAKEMREAVEAAKWAVAPDTAAAEYRPPKEARLQDELEALRLDYTRALLVLDSVTHSLNTLQLQQQFTAKELELLKAVLKSEQSKRKRAEAGEANLREKIRQLQELIMALNQRLATKEAKAAVQKN